MAKRSTGAREDLDIRRYAGLIISAILIAIVTGVWIATRGLTNPIQVTQTQGYSSDTISIAPAEAAPQPAAETAEPNEVPQEAAAQPDAEGQAQEADLVKQEVPTERTKEQPPKKIAKKTTAPARKVVKVASRSNRYFEGRRYVGRRLTIFFGQDEDDFDRYEKRRKERRKRRSSDDN